MFELLPFQISPAIPHILQLPRTYIRACALWPESLPRFFYLSSKLNLLSFLTYQPDQLVNLHILLTHHQKIAIKQQHVLIVSYNNAPIS